MSDNNGKILSNVEHGTSILRMCEIEVLATMAEIALRNCSAEFDGLVERPKRGTVIIDGQKYGEPAELILRFDLSGGPLTHYGNNDSYTSDEGVADTMDTILGFPNQPGVSEYYSYQNE